MDYYRMRKCYFKAIKFNIPNAMNDLGYYYGMILKDTVRMEYYYKMAIEKHEFLYSMNNLGVYYKNVTKDYVEMEKYLRMGIERGCKYCMYSLALYFHKIECNEDFMVKFYHESFKTGYKDAYYMLGLYYQFDNINYSKMLIYYTININTFKCTKSMLKLGVYYHDILHDETMYLKYFKMAIEYKNMMGYHYLALVSKFKNDHSKVVKYYNLAITEGDIEISMHNLAVYYAGINDPRSDIFFIMAIIKGNKLSLNELISIKYREEKEFIIKNTNTGINVDSIALLSQTSGLNIQKLLIVRKLLFLHDNNFEDINFRKFIILNYLSDEKEKSIEFLKKFTLTQNLDLNYFREYREYIELKFKLNMLHTSENLITSKIVVFKFK